MTPSAIEKTKSAIFITFSGNCRQALKFYQTCFGGLLQLDFLEQALPGFKQAPLVSGHLKSERVDIYGSDLVHDEGRKIGNYIAIYISCWSDEDRYTLIKKLEMGTTKRNRKPSTALRLVEITDVFGVNWVLGV